MSDIDFNKIISEESDFSVRGESVKNNVSPAVIKRLPRYFRYLRELIRSGKTRISSGELSDIMNVTASQIRQDLNCFGGFGQQGYGYNVNYLYAKICEILGVGKGFCAVIIGAGNLGSALVRNPMFEKRGVDVVAMFDVSADVVGRTISGVPVLHMDELEKFCRENCVDIAHTVVESRKNKRLLGLRNDQKDTVWYAAIPGKKQETISFGEAILLTHGLTVMIHGKEVVVL